MKRITLFIITFVVTAYLYYFYHSELAHITLRYGIATLPIFVIGFFLVTFILSRMLSLPFLKKKKTMPQPQPQLSETTPRKILLPQLLLGILAGILIILPAIFFLLWIYLKIRN